jgi:hypothetical protein
VGVAGVVVLLKGERLVVEVEVETTLRGLGSVRIRFEREIEEGFRRFCGGGEMLKGCLSARLLYLRLLSLVGLRVQTVMICQ